MSKELKNVLPDYKDLKLKCHDFLANFIENGSPKYLDKLQEIADGYNSVLEIALDDVKSYKNDDAFFEAIKLNAPRSVRIFEEVAENLMPASSISMSEHTTNNFINNIEAALTTTTLSSFNSRSTPSLDVALSNQDMSNNPPKSYLRRFRVLLMPERSFVPKSLRYITSDSVGHLTATTGMVSRISDVKPHITVCTYTCEVCGFEVYQEVAGHQFMPLFSCTSPICKENKSGRLQIQLRGSKFHKYQEIKIQELPDQVPIGNIPRTMTVHCLDSETRKCSPGDIITVYGILMVMRRTGYKAMVSGLQTDCFIEASKIVKEKESYEDISKQSIDAVTAIRNIIGDGDTYEILSKSIAPEIYGHDDIKKALLLQLVGGVSRSLPDGVKIRGDVNICLMGDPGLAKSQLLKYVASIAPRGVYTTGKGSSGVGLTAAVTRDTITGEMTLEGGALVLADRGICCIDEFDKMNESDRTAIHEVMEQQTISIAKAGIHTTLNARASVLAAANPSFGRYNFRKSISENVNLPNSLLSRFDLLFIIVDKVDTSTDISLSKHILFVHRFSHNPITNAQIIDPQLMKAYIAEARRITPSIPRDLSNYVVEAYISMRAQSSTSNWMGKVDDQTALTPRQLLSILRLSQSLARLRLSDNVSFADVDEALRLIQSSKASLFMEKGVRNVEDFSSTIFNIIRDAMPMFQNRTMDYNIVEGMVLKRGFTGEQFKKSLSEYESLGIVVLDDLRSKITLAT